MTAPLPPSCRSVPLPRPVGRMGMTWAACCLAFNRRGTYLAIGWAHGEATVFDMHTRQATHMMGLSG
jgi:hypothetical protein